jgi:RNA polymerase sigma-70 factor (ECF subfamily)
MLVMMDDERLALRFEQDRGHLHAVAYRLLGSRAEADDAVQESWLRLNRSDVTAVDNLTGWLTTVVARISLDMLRARTTRREQTWEAQHAELAAAGVDPEQEALVADAVGEALLVVLGTLSPAERVSFVLHDMFDLPFDEIAPLVGRTAVATRQLASRARRRVRGAEPASGDTREQTRAVVSAFLKASREGDLDALLAVLAPDVTAHADEATVSAGAEAEVRGSAAVAATFSGRARAARLALVDGEVAAVWTHHGEPRVVFFFTVDGDLVTQIEMVADPNTLGALAIDFSHT